MVLESSAFAIATASVSLAPSDEKILYRSRRRCGVKVRVKGDPGKSIWRRLPLVDPSVTGFLSATVGDRLVRLVLGRVETNVLILVGTVRVGARAEEYEGESNDGVVARMFAASCLACRTREAKCGSPTRSVTSLFLNSYVFEDNLRRQNKTLKVHIWRTLKVGIWNGLIF